MYDLGLRGTSSALILTLMTTQQAARSKQHDAHVKAHNMYMSRQRIEAIRSIRAKNLENLRDMSGARYYRGGRG